MKGNLKHTSSLEADYCWQTSEGGAAVVAVHSTPMTPSPRSENASPKLSLSTPLSPRRIMPRQRTSVGPGSSPLHVAALVAAAARAAIVSTTTAPDSQILRHESVNRLFFHSDEVFKAYESVVRTDDGDAERKQTTKSVSAPNRLIKKVASVDIGEGAIRRRARFLQQKALKENTMALSVDDVSEGGGKRLLDVPLTASTERLNDPEASAACSSSSSFLRRRASSSQHQQLQKALQMVDAKRRLSGQSAESAHMKKVDLEVEYNIYRHLGTGRFGFVKLAEHKPSGQKIALKFFPRPQIKLGEFVREYNFSRFLSPHPNILDTFEGVYQTDDESAFFFVQEFCPHASLREAVEKSNGGLGELATKAIMLKVLSAMEFMHSEGLVHRNLKAENVLIFDPFAYTRVKICDFGLTRKRESNVKHLEYVNSYHAPELCETVAKEMFTVSRSIDIWALGILFFYCLKGRFPWQKATIMCKPYWEWDQWLKHKLPQLPKHHENHTEKALKLFKRCLNPRPKDRWTIKDLKKFVEKEKLLKGKNTDEDLIYYPDGNDVSKKGTETSDAAKQKKSTVQKLINSTFNTVAEISEQVVSARD